MAERPRGPRQGASKKSATSTSGSKSAGSARTPANRPAAPRPMTKTAAAQSDRKRRKKPLTFGRVVGRIFLILLGVIVAGGVAAAAFVVISYQRLTLPDPNAEFTTNTSYIYFAGGKSKLGDIEIQ